MDYRQLAVEGARELAFLCVFIQRQLWHGVVFGIVGQEGIVVQGGGCGDDALYFYIPDRHFPACSAISLHVAIAKAGILHSRN
jgi:hypothetical protein